MKSNLIKRIAALALSMLMVISLFGCSNSESSEGGNKNPNKSDSGVTDFKTVALPFSNKDVLNPYTAQTKQNQELSKLLFDPLFKINEDFMVDGYIADSYECTPTTCTVKLKTILFTDGTPLTANDVVYSFNRAKANQVYSAQLSYVSSCTAVDSVTVSFKSSKNNPNFVNLLDFPIIKSGSDNLKDENNRTLPPIGCGRYTFSYENQRLIANDKYYKSKVKLSQISLVDCPDNDSLSHHISAGNISSIYSDLSDNAMPKKSGTPTTTAGTNLFFIGVNSESGLLSNAKLRLALSAAVDRQALCDKSFYTYATPAISILPSDWQRVKNYESLNKTQNLKQTIAYLEEIGYTSKDVDGYFVDENNERISLRLLCSDSNSARVACASQIEDQLNKAGFEISVSILSAKDYTTALTYGHFDIYIGEVKLDNSLYFGKILSDSVVYGFPSQSECKNSFNQYYEGNLDITAAISSFASELPFIPICYKSGVSINSEWLSPHIKFSISDVYNGIENYS